MMNLFNNTPVAFNLPDAELLYYPDFFSTEEANVILQKIIEETPWQQDNITVFGKTHPQPRLTALYANNSKPYSYSGISMRPYAFTDTLLGIKEKIENCTPEIFTTCLVNLYRDGQDSNGWHADNEKELGKNPVIASVSFGAERLFKLKHKKDSSLKKDIILKHGSLLLMKGTTQHHWLHTLPKTKKKVDPRVNLTFRIVY